MIVSYKRLWKLLIDKDMKKKDLVKAAHISTYTVNKLNRGDNVNTDTLVKICSALNCAIEDIMEIIPDSGEKDPVQQSHPLTNIAGLLVYEFLHLTLW